MPFIDIDQVPIYGDTAYTGAPESLFDTTTNSIHRMLRQMWAHGSDGWNLSATKTDAATKARPRTNDPRFVTTWPDLIYAYLIENTRVCEVMGKVIQGFVLGESLGTPLAAAHNWMWNTEKLWYRLPPVTSPMAVVSDLRETGEAVRRNAYFRVFGLDLNFPPATTIPEAVLHPAIANRAFVQTWEEFLAEIWVGVAHATSIGPNPTDPQRIAQLAQSLQDMLLARKQGWQIAHETFYAVSMMAWFHYTMNYQSAIVMSLGCQALSPGQQLAKIGEKVGVTVPKHADALFDLAIPMADTITEIQKGDYNTANFAQMLYTFPTTRERMIGIINNYMQATGKNLKSAPVRVPA